MNENKALVSHFGDLKRTMIICLMITAAGSVAAYCFFGNRIMEFLTAGLCAKGVPLIYTSVTESFATEMKVGLIAGAICTFPVDAIVIWSFIFPALFREEKKKAIMYTTVSMILFVAGILFGYFILFPFVLDFFLSSCTENITAMISIDSYISFLCRLILPFGLIAEIPLVEMLLITHDIVSIKRLGKLRKYVFLVCVIMGAVLTPPDVVSQLCVALPMYALFECGIIAGRIMKNNKYKKEKQKNE
jgi:sec-independent protein translocase protein TatC